MVLGHDLANRQVESGFETKIAIRQNAHQPSVFRDWHSGDLVMCHELKYIQQTMFESMEQDGERLTQLINGYVGYLKRSKQGQNEPGGNHSVREDPSPYILEPSDFPADDSPFPNPE